MTQSDKQIALQYLEPPSADQLAERYARAYNTMAAMTTSRAELLHLRAHTLNAVSDDGLDRAAWIAYYREHYEN